MSSHSFNKMIAAGPEYMLQAFERQNENGWKPLRTNPTIDEVHDAVIYHAPASVLEIGCGWGRLTSPLNQRMGGCVEGCDYLPEMLARCDGTFRAFPWDCLKNEPRLAHKWDVTFTRGVFLYFAGDGLVADAMNSILAITAKRAIFWEWPETIRAMIATCRDPRIEYRVVAHLEE